MLSLFGNLLDEGTILRTKTFHLGLTQIHDGDRLELIKERSLFSFFGSIGIEKVRELSFSMPETTLMVHPFSKEIFLDPWASVGEEDFELFIVEPSLEVFSNLRPAGVDPEPHGFKTALRTP